MEPKKVTKTRKVKTQEVQQPKTVVTFSGATELITNCRKVGDKYYKIGNIEQKDSGDIFLINDVWFRLSLGRIAWDYTLGQYNMVENMVKGFIYDPENPRLELRYFTPTYESIRLNDGTFCASEEDAIKLKLKYDFSNGLYGVQVELNKPTILRQKPRYAKLPTDIYSLSEYPSHILSNLSTTRKAFVETLKEHEFDTLLPYTYGLELETEGGYFPEKSYFDIGAVPLKDGSIAGTEITTLPFSGKKIFNYFTHIFDKLTQYNIVTSNNSFHVNLSGFNNTPEFRIALYNLYYRLQPEIYSYIPVYKRVVEYLANKMGGAKDHCKPLEALGIVKKYKVDDPKAFKDEIAKADEVIFKWLNEGHYNAESNPKTRVHIKQGSPKWEMHNRYFNLNLIPLYFGNVANSRIEFRLHHGTVNKYKALHWLILCSAIVNYTENNIAKILEQKEKIKIQDVLEFYFEGHPKKDFLLEWFMQYIETKEKENTNLVTAHDINGMLKNEFISDNVFRFAINNRDIFNV